MNASLNTAMAALDAELASLKAEMNQALARSLANGLSLAERKEALLKYQELSNQQSQLFARQNDLLAQQHAKTHAAAMRAISECTAAMRAISA